VPAGTKRVTIKIRAGFRTVTASMLQHNCEPTFVVTVHKSQGSTVLLAIVSLLARPTKPSRKDFHAAYVFMTRFRNGEDMRVLADLLDMEWLDDLTPPPELMAFLDGYDAAGVWHRDVAHRSLQQRTGTASSVTGARASRSASRNQAASRRAVSRVSRGGAAAAGASTAVGAAAGAVVAAGAAIGLSTSAAAGTAAAAAIWLRAHAAELGYQDQLAELVAAQELLQQHLQRYQGSRKQF